LLGRERALVIAARELRALGGEAFEEMERAGISNRSLALVEAAHKRHFS
jgi:hypothetical protein